MGFIKNVHEIVKLIPPGYVMAYDDIADVLGKPKKARMVGIAMKFCPSDYPWQRVVKPNGKVVTGALQVMVLLKEGISFSGDVYVNLDKNRLTADEMRSIISGRWIEGKKE